MTTKHITAGAAGTWQLGEKRINRIGFGAMRLIGNLSTRSPPTARTRSPSSAAPPSSA